MSKETYYRQLVEEDSTVSKMSIQGTSDRGDILGTDFPEFGPLTFPIWARTSVPRLTVSFWLMRIRSSEYTAPVRSTRLSY